MYFFFNCFFHFLLCERNTQDLFKDRIVLILFVASGWPSEDSIPFLCQKSTFVLCASTGCPAYKKDNIRHLSTLHHVLNNFTVNSPVTVLSCLASVFINEMMQH